MFLLNNLKSVAIGSVAPGNLIILRHGAGLSPAIIGSDRGPKLDKDPPATVIVDLEPGNAPVLYPPQNTSAKCIDLGKPEVRAAGEKGEWLTLDTKYSRPGNIAIEEAGAWIICQDARNSIEAWLKIPTGDIGPQCVDVFYVCRWELGVRDADGKFLRLYLYTSP